MITDNNNEFNKQKIVCQCNTNYKVVEKYMEIRELNQNDAKAFYDCMKELDQETEYMMFEPDERVWNEVEICKMLKNRDNLLIGAFIKNSIIGFLSAERGVYRRIRHSAYIVIGIRKEYCNKGIGTNFFKILDDWAVKNKLTRLELTVEITNKSAINLYEKSGFVIEGIKKNTMLVNGVYIDEYIMSKIF